MGLMNNALNSHNPETVMITIKSKINNNRESIELSHGHSAGIIFLGGIVQWASWSRLLSIERCRCLVDYSDVVVVVRTSAA